MFARSLIRTVRPALRTVRPTTFALPVLHSRNLTSKITAAPTALSTKLDVEIKYETEAGVGSSEPEFLTNFKQEGIWTIEDKPGHDEVTLVRSYKSETIRVTFSIADIDAEQDELDAFGEDELTEESADQGSGEEKLVGEDGEEGDEDQGGLPVRAAIVITKPGTGALSIDAVAEDGLFSIENISYYDDAALATDLSSEADFARRGLYMGPNFENLDESVQAEFETYLEERGVNSSLALFIPDLAEHKEQKEYLTWLKSVKGFLEK